MATPCIISVAITGSVPRKKDNPAVPISVPEQVKSRHAAYEAGAALVHDRPVASAAQARRLLHLA
ncbi:MAG TPA: 3-keto-5-aminohexanoate cleavage protein [Acetobacteraceae bacterium]|nr:3-keto-5-aminohexanoate cleavage protein [Acetobacteraceae bacterium]